MNASLSRAEVYENALRQQEISLRECHVSSVLELNRLDDKYDSMDLVGNDLTALQKPFPEFLRVKTLLLAHNGIAKIDPEFAYMAPNVSVLSLAANPIADLQQLLFLKNLRKLTCLVLEGCPVARVPGYRRAVIKLCPWVRDLDFQRVKQAERQAAVSAPADDTLLAERAALMQELENVATLAELDALELRLRELNRRISLSRGTQEDKSEETVSRSRLQT